MKKSIKRIFTAATLLLLACNIISPSNAYAVKNYPGGKFNGPVQFMQGITDENERSLGNGLYSRTKTIVDPLNSGEDDAMPLFGNESGYTWTLTAIKVKCLTEVNFTIKETGTNDYTNLTTVQVVLCDEAGTGVKYEDITSITHDTIETGHDLVYDNHVTDEPTWVKITIIYTKS